MFLGFTKILQVVLTVLPVLEKVAPIGKQLAALTPWDWDDKAMSTLEKAITFGRNILGETEIREAQRQGVEAAIKANTLGLTPDETQRAVDSGLMLAARTKEIRRGVRQQLVNGVPVVLGDRTLTTIADLKAMPNSTFRLIAEAEYNALKAGGNTE